MSYETFGNFGGGKHVDDVIRAANKQKRAGEAVQALVSPFSFVVKKGADMISGGQPVSDEQYIRAIILKVLRERGLIGDDNLKKKLRSMVKEILQEDTISSHPHWSNPTLKRRGYRK